MLIQLNSMKAKILLVNVTEQTETLLQTLPGIKDGRAIATGKKHARLVLKNLQEEDSGTYKCVAMSGDNAKNVKSIEVDVKGIINLMLQSSIFYAVIHIFYA